LPESGRIAFEYHAGDWEFLQGARGEGVQLVFAAGDDFRLQIGGVGVSRSFRESVNGRGRNDDVEQGDFALEVAGQCGGILDRTLAAR